MSYPHQPGYPQRQYGPPPGPYPVYARPAKTSTKGARWMTFIGVFLLVLAVAAAIGTVLIFKAVAQGVQIIDNHGNPGLRTFGGDHGVSPPAARSMRSL